MFSGLSVSLYWHFRTSLPSVMPFCVPDPHLSSGLSWHSAFTTVLWLCTPQLLLHSVTHSGHAVQKIGFVLGFLHIPVSALLNRYIVFEGEEGQDAGGLLREWYMIISREMFNPMYALFRTSPGDRVTYTINPSSHCNPNHLSYFKFVGRIVAKAVYDNRLLECYFTRSFYKHILGKSVR